MRLHVITVGQPKLEYTQSGWSEYWTRLKHYHQLRATHIPDRQNDAGHLLAAAGKSFKVVLVVEGQEFSSRGLAHFLQKRELEAREVSLTVGGPDGLPEEVIAQADYAWSLGALTLPHDLAMVVLLEALYRASTINYGQPYHRD
jgi:23S rRNA (pseudouridine1915-N3)-methyltransferase